MFRAFPPEHFFDEVFLMTEWYRRGSLRLRGRYVARVANATGKSAAMQPLKPTVKPSGGKSHGTWNIELFGLHGVWVTKTLLIPFLHVTLVRIPSKDPYSMVEFSAFVLISPCAACAVAWLGTLSWGGWCGDSVEVVNWIKQNWIDYPEMNWMEVWGTTMNMIIKYD